MVTTHFTCETPEQTFQLGMIIGQKAKPGEIWSLVGPLGAGKTHFVKGLAKGLGFEGSVTSPTFTLQHIYEGRLTLFHFDWYRLEKAEEAEDLGWAEWTGRGGVVAVEWGDKFPKLLPPTALKLIFEITEGESRRMTAEATHPESIPQVEELIRCWPP
ncbi:MAG TPA: tRNA (adenosine(37)-N6)-threonylcarbamoyltransferase complex ATPase subunit type 1 TsaE [bacterium]|nr:tRNA (adenosine(37)-N6)-threonylcarbamoyltransferase complex ATPase subunit type 1 TsaE [bacterium]